MNVSDLEVSADLKYVTVGINGTNLIQGDVSDPFTAQDQGKLIAIKKAFHNGPTYLESLEYTNPGRIVTATATIDTVYEATNEALIAFEGLFYDNVSHPNGWQLTETGTARAYVYTNNYIALQEAMDSCYSAQVEFLDLDLNGVIGINPIYNRTNENRALLFDGLSGNLTLRNVANSRLKLCTEFIGTNLPAEGLDIGLAENYTLISRHALFSDRNNRNGTPTNVSVIHGNSSVLVSCVPPDLAGTPWRHFSPAIFNGTLRAPSNAIIRDLTLDGIGWSATDVDGNDSFWRTVYVNSGYGATQQLEDVYQELRPAISCRICSILKQLQYKRGASRQCTSHQD